MRGKFIKLGLLFFTLGLLGCGGEEKPQQEVTQSDPQPSKPAAPKLDPIQAPLVGQPSASGYSEDPIRVQLGPDEGLRAQENPSEGAQFLFVRVPVNGPATLVPKDYCIMHEGKPYTPHAIGFGRPNGVYSSVETFVGKRVDVVPGGEDQILHDGERVQKAVLKNPSVFLVYDVPQVNNPKLWHGATAFALTPNFAALREELSGSGGTLTAQNTLNLTDPNATSEEYSAELLSSTRTRLELNNAQMDVVVITLGLTAPKPVTIELDKSELALRGDGGSAPGRTIYFHFSDDSAKLTTSSVYTKEETDTYEGRPLIGLDSGGFRVSLSPGNTLTVTMIFPDPKIAGDLELKLSSTHSVEIPEPVNPLGKFPPPVEKLPAMVAWSPMIGTPTDAGFLNEDVSIAADPKQISAPQSTKAADGLRHLVVTFRVSEEGPFVPIDYRIVEKQSNTIYRPVAVAFGESPIYVKGLDYEKIPLTFGETTAPTLKGSQVAGWTIHTKEVRLLYEVEAASEYIFIHGGTQFVIEL